jgi:hypothetical protein
MGADALGSERVRIRANRNAWAVLVLAMLPALSPFAKAQKAPPAAHEAQSYPAVDVHASEHVAVAADPLDSRDKESIFRIDYLKAGFMPVRLIVTNTGDTRVKLDEVRVYFVTAEGEKVKAAVPDDVERAVRDVGNPTRQMEMPFPLKGIGRPKNKDPKVEADFKLADFADLTVAPHATQSGYLFFDVSGMEAPLNGAKLLVRGIETADGTQLFYFEAPFDKYLAEKHK